MTMREFLAVLLVAGLIVVAAAIVLSTPALAATCGKASFYGSAHQGKLMANGKPFNRHRLTAASWLYPLGTVLFVRNVQNGKNVQITVTDRGPAKRLHRVIDLSEAAFARLAPTSQGLVNVCITERN